MTSLDQLQQEAMLMGRYLLDVDPSAALIQRYVDANQQLLSDKNTARDLAPLVFVRRHPWALPYVDAACGLLQPDALLRNKLLVMVAILEATPDHVAAFFPVTLSKPVFLLRLFGLGLSAGGKFALGCLLYPLAMRAR